MCLNKYNFFLNLAFGQVGEQNEGRDWFYIFYTITMNYFHEGLSIPAPLVTCVVLLTFMKGYQFLLH